jgi:integrase
MTNGLRRSVKNTMTKWIQTKYEGIRYREHPTRKNGLRPDKYYVIRYRVNGVRKEEALGWESKGWNLEKVRETFAKLTVAQKTAEGPATLEERRAEVLAAKIEAEVQAHMEEAKRITLREYWPEYLKAAKLKKKTKSWQTEDGYFKNWIDELLGHIPMREIGLAQWDLLMNAMTDAGLSPRTRQYVALTLRQALDHAFMRKIIPEAPPRAKHIGATLKPDSNRRTRTLTVQELHAILEALNERDQAAYRVTLFCALTCARFGEAAGLEWKDVDLVLGSATFRDTKNGTDRIIPLSQTLVDFLRGLKKEKAADAERKHGLVFPNGDGGIYRQTPQPFRKVVESLGLNEGRDKRDRVVFHSLRHTGATRLGQANTPLRDMMDLAGWKTPSMALRYQHSGDAGRRRAMAALEGLTQVEPAKVVELFANDKK